MLPPEYDYYDPRIYHVSTVDPFTLWRLCSQSVPHFLERFTRLRNDYSLPASLIGDLLQVRVSEGAIWTVLSLAFLFTLIRYALQYIAQFWIEHHNISPLYSYKLPESFWKLSYYGGIWLYSLYIHCYQVNTFRDPLSMWKDWQDGQVPAYNPHVVILYAIQTAFYVHSLYATLYMDLWRQDSWIMFLHHFVAIALLYLSYAMNYTLAGALVLFLQDNSDAALEITKICVYLKKRTDGTYYPALDFAGKAVLQMFGILWIVFRLYWYPCKLLYATAYGAVYLAPQDASLFPLIGIMLVMLYLLNLFWFNFIVRMCIRVLRTGEEPEDNREYDTTAVSGKSKRERLKERLEDLRKRRKH